MNLNCAKKKKECGIVCMEFILYLSVRDLLLQSGNSFPIWKLFPVPDWETFTLTFVELWSCCGFQMWKLFLNHETIS